MPIPELCERLQEAWISRAISESTWGYPVVGALHVLAFVLFGGAIILPDFRKETRWLRVVGLSLVILTGIVLFAAGAVGYFNSASFRIKLLLLVFVVLDMALSRRDRSKLHSGISLALWAAVIFASRGIAFF